MSKKIKLFSVALAVFVVVLFAFAGTALAAGYDFINHAVDHSMVAAASSNDRHNVAPVGTDPCEYCHEPHGATAAFLWKLPLSQVLPQKGQQIQGTTVDDASVANAGSSSITPYGSDIKPLCYSCHDGTVLVPRISGGATTVSVGSMTAFSTTHFNHRTTAASAVSVSSDPTKNGIKAGLGKDCDRCHDPHDDTMGKYLRPEFKTRVYDENGQVVKTNAAGTAVLPYSSDPLSAAYAAYNASTAKTVSWWSPLIKGGDFCATCHESNLPSMTATTKRNAHPVYQPAGFLVWNSATESISNITVTGTGSSMSLILNGRSTTPVLATNPVPGKTPTASVWPKAGLYDPTGSALYNGTRVFDPTINAANLNTVVSTQNSTAVVMCESCHGPHGANTATAIGSTGNPFHYLNTMDPATLCANCH